MGIGVIITAIIGIVTSFTSSWITWYFTREKYNAEVDNTVIDGMRESLEFYQKLSDDNKKRLDEVLVRNANLEDEVRELRKQVLTLTTMVCTDLTCQLRKLDRHEIKITTGV